MKLWLVERKDEVGWDEYESFVVRAETAKQAFNLAGIASDDFLNRDTLEISIIRGKGRAGIIHSSFNAG